MADLKISQLPALGDNLATADKIAVVDGSASETKSLTIANLFSANSFGLLSSNAIPIAKVSVTAGSIAGTAIADLGISTAKVANDAITAAKLDNNSSAQIVTSLPGSGGFTGQIAANSNDGYAASIWDGSAWQSLKAAASINTIAGDTTSIVNIAVATSGSTRTISASIDDSSAAAQFMAGPSGAAGSVSLRAITGADLPLATSSAQGTIKINGEGLRIDAGVIEIDNDVTASSAYNLVTVTAKGLVSAYRTITSNDLPAGTTSAKGALQVGTGLAVSNGVVSVDNTATAGTYTKVTITASGLVSSGASLADSDLPNHSAALLTSGTLAAARIGTDTVDGSKLSNSSTTIFQSIAQQGFPTAQFNGQLCFDTVAEDAYIWDGTAWQAITTLTKGSLVYGGTYNATTSKVVAPTAAGIAAGLVTGSNLPSASSTTDGLYVVVSVGGTPSGIGITTALNPPDYILGVTSSSSSGGSSWQEIDLSATVSGQIAQNVGFTPFSGLSSTNCQDALEELETEKLSKTGGTVSGEILIGNAGSLVFEGATADAFETTIGVVDPTTADKTINFPDQSGTVLVSGGASIVNADVATNAALAYSKLAALASGSILIGSASNVATVQALSGDATLSNAGVLTIASSAITNAKISSSAAIALSKLATGALPTAITIANSNVASDAAIAGSKISPDFGTQAITTTGNLTLNNQADLRLGDSDGSHYVAIQAGATIGTNYTIELPTTVGATGKVLKSTVNGQVATLTWEDDASNTAASALTGNTLASGVTASSLQSLGTLSGLVVDGDMTLTGQSANIVFDKSDNALEFADSAKAIFGAGSDLQIFHSTNSHIQNSTGNLYIGNNYSGDVGGDIYIQAKYQENSIIAFDDGGVELYYDNSLRFQTDSNGCTVHDTRLQFNDNTKAQFGTGGDFQIFHNGSHSFITDRGTGNLYIRGADDVRIEKYVDDSNGEPMIVANVDGAVELYHDNFKTFETNDNGIRIFGNEGNAGQFQIYADEGDDNADKWLIEAGTNGALEIKNFASGSWETNLKLTGDAGVHLYYDNSAVCYTDTDALRFNDNQYLKLGSSQDLQIYHSGSHSFIKDGGTGNLQMWTNQLSLLASGGTESMIQAIENAQVELYYDSVKKFETDSGGINVIDDDSTVEITLTDSGGAAGHIYGKQSDGLISILVGNGEYAVNAYQNGAVKLYYDNDAKLETTSTGVTVTGTVSDSKGNLRSIPLVDAPNAHTMAASDAGKAIYLQNNLTIPASTMSEGDAVTIINNSSSDKTITCSAITMYLAGDTTAKTSLTLAGRGMATVWFRNNSNAIISGAGLS